MMRVNPAKQFDCAPLYTRVTRRASPFTRLGHIASSHPLAVAERRVSPVSTSGRLESEKGLSSSLFAPKAHVIIGGGAPSRPGRREERRSAQPPRFSGERHFPSGLHPLRRRVRFTM